MTNKQQAFVEHYLTTWNATEAARRAGYSADTAYSIGQRLLKNVEVAAYIEQRLDELHMSADEVLKRLADQARGSMEDFGEVTDKGTFVLDLKKAKDAGALALVKKIKPTKTGYELELYDAQAALVHIGKAHGLFKDITEFSGRDGEPITVKVLKGSTSVDDLRE